MKWFMSIIVMLLAVVLVAPEVEAGRKSKIKSRSVSRCQTDGCSTSKTSYSFDSACSSSSISQTVTETIAESPSSGSGKIVVKSSYRGPDTSGIQAWAIDEANRMADFGTNGHTKPAPLGYFVGVGCNGSTCMKSGAPVAEVHIRGKSVRVWRN